MRWVNRARLVLYGTAPRRPSYPLERPAQPELSHFVFPSMHGTKKLQLHPPRHPELFIALNRHEIQDDYLASIQHQIDSQKQVHDAVLNMWQKSITENVLYYDGKHLVTTRLDPKTFLLRDNDCVAQNSEGCLTDVRYIDVGETGKALSKRSQLSPDSEIIFMCQHPRNTNTFATCHRSHIMIWSWFGTDTLETDRMASVTEGGFIRDDNSIIYGMTFLSEVPESISSTDGRVLMLLTGQTHRPWLTIKVYLVQSCAHRILYEIDIRKDGSLLDAAKSGKLIFKTSHSDRVLVIGGKGIALFYEINWSAPPSGELALSLVKDVAKLAAEDYLNMVSCLCLPAPVRSGIDWIVLSDTEGDLYGFLFQEEAGRVTLSSNGRFSSKQQQHDRGVPVGSLMPSNGATPHCHYSKIKEQGISYTVFLEGMECERDRFFSLGDNGKLLAWTLQKHGWASQVEDGMDGMEPHVLGSRRYVVAQPSRLVPHVMVAVDQATQKMVCLDTVSKRMRHPMESMSIVGGA